MLENQNKALIEELKSLKELYTGNPRKVNLANSKVQHTPKKCLSVNTDQCSLFRRKDDVNRINIWLKYFSTNNGQEFKEHWLNWNRWKYKRKVTETDISASRTYLCKKREVIHCTLCATIISMIIRLIAIHTCQVKWIIPIEKGDVKPYFIFVNFFTDVTNRKFG